MQISPALLDVAKRAGLEANGSGIKLFDQLAPMCHGISIVH